MPLDQQLEGFEEQQRKEMSFIEHLEELRWHIMRSLVAIMIVAVVLFIGKRIVFDWMIFGPISPSFPTYAALCKLSQYISIGTSFCAQEFNKN